MYRLRRSLAQNWLEWLVLGAIVALAAFLRLVRLDLAVFQDGEAEVLTLASSFLETGYPPLVGIKTSVDNFNTPVMVYLMALPMIVSSDPAIATGLLALLNVLAIFLTYRFSKDYFGRQAAIMAALLFAVSFWAVTYSR